MLFQSPYIVGKEKQMFHYYVDQPAVPQKVIEKRWQQDIEGKIESLEDYKKEIDKKIKAYKADLKAIQ